MKSKENKRKQRNLVSGFAVTHGKKGRRLSTIVAYREMVLAELNDLLEDLRLDVGKRNLNVRVFLFGVLCRKTQD